MRFDFQGSTVSFGREIRREILRHKFVAKTQEYFVYFKVFAADLWGKSAVKARRRNCAVLP